MGPRKKITREFPLNLIWFHFTGKSFVFFSTFSMISKKSNLEGVFEFFYSDPQLDPNFKPTRNLSGQLLYIYLCIYPNCANNRDVFFGTPPPGTTQKVSNRHHYSYYWNSLFFIKSVMIICAAYLQKNLKP